MRKKKYLYVFDNGYSYSDFNVRIFESTLPPDIAKEMFGDESLKFSDYQDAPTCMSWCPVGAGERSVPDTLKELLPYLLDVDKVAKSKYAQIPEVAAALA